MAGARIPIMEGPDEYVIIISEQSFLRVAVLLILVILVLVCIGWLISNGTETERKKVKVVTVMKSDMEEQRLCN